MLIAGVLLGRPGHEGLIPSAWVASLFGGNSLSANLFASVFGAGMGKGPALALLLAGPALSLLNMLVIRSVMGTKKTVVFVLLVMVMATISGLIFGAFF